MAKGGDAHVKVGKKKALKLARLASKSGTKKEVTSRPTTNLGSNGRIIQGGKGKGGGKGSGKGGKGGGKGGKGGKGGGKGGGGKVGCVQPPPAAFKSINST